MTPEDLPAYSDLILPTVRAVADLGGSAQVREITGQVFTDLDPSDEMLAVSQPNRPDASVLQERINWARSYAKLIGALDSPSRGVFLLTPLGKQLLAMPEDEAHKRTLELDREYRRNRAHRSKSKSSTTVEALAAEPTDEPEDQIEDGDGPRLWQDILLGRLHRLSPEAFEEFVLYLLRLYGLELKRVGGTGDEGIDGIGTAPLSAVLSSRVAVQVKRFDPRTGRAVGREIVALFQRDAQTKGAERAILVTLGKFSEPARKAATAATPTVDLIDGERLTQLVLEQELGVKLAPTVDERWFDRFD